MKTRDDDTYQWRYRAAHREAMAASSRKWNATHKDECTAYSRKYRATHPERTAGRLAVYRAIRRGELCRPSSCELCGAITLLHAHHHDYSRPVDVIFLCVLCHRTVHAMADSFAAAVAAM